MHDFIINNLMSTMFKFDLNISGMPSQGVQVFVLFRIPGVASWW